MKKTIELYHKYQEIIGYIIFGVLTTVVNIAVYFFCKDFLELDYKISNAISWLLSVLFAFSTNKFFVFNSKSLKFKIILRELILFFWYRGLSFIIDMILMIVLVSKLEVNDGISKVIVQIIVIILNYIFSKLFIFKDN
ncbi:GtrA family protein [Carnobacterium divergens]|uniref:GtrA family protein n=1 Tax=Carnobacterium divergens TaxID=2748 RepID=UPI00054E47E0|nr:GtrA family protein [Carnobacterium divergens]MDO0875612.1 GtrA family protein [Carnobacterium divergens]SUX16599.1 GtrA-like protein [Carnobacterium divergens]